MDKLRKAGVCYLSLPITFYTSEANGKVVSPRDGRLDQCVECSTCKYEDLKLIPRTQVKSKVRWHVSRSQTQKDSWCGGWQRGYYQLMKLNWQVTSSVRGYLKKSKVIEEDTSGLFRSITARSSFSITKAFSLWYNGPEVPLLHIGQSALLSKLRFIPFWHTY